LTQLNLFIYGISRGAGFNKQTLKTQSIKTQEHKNTKTTQKRIHSFIYFCSQKVKQLQMRHAQQQEQDSKV